MGESYTFEPQIDAKSKRLLKDRKGSVENRLVNQTKKREEKLA